MNHRVQAKFDRVAAGYTDKYDHPKTILDLEKLRRQEITLEYARTLRPQSVLDAGCGCGNVLASLQYALPDSQFVGTDLSFAMLAHARSQTQPDTKLLQSLAERLPFATGSFDMVYALGLVDYLPNPSAFFQDARRILKPTGHLIFTYPNRQSVNRKLRNMDQALRSAIKASWSRTVLGKKTVAASPLRTVEVDRLLAASGFESIRRNFITYGNGVFRHPWSLPLSQAMERWLHGTFVSRHLAWSCWCAAQRVSLPTGGETENDTLVNRHSRAA